LGFQPYSAGLEIGVVGDDEDAFRLDSELTRQRGDGPSAKVHEGQGLGQNNGAASDTPEAEPGLMPSLIQLDPMSVREPIDDLEAEVVARSSVLRPRVPQTDY
jgi:hypothetical protein